MKLSLTRSPVLHNNPALLIAMISLVAALAIACVVKLVQGELLGMAVTSTVEHFGKSAELEGQLSEDIRHGFNERLSER